MHTEDPDKEIEDRLQAGKMPPLVKTLDEDLLTNPQPQTDDMEVHHHAHHQDRKSFKAYLLEGLMIFVAVTMGFLAENVREYISNKEKEKHYIGSYLKNLQSDSAELRNTIKRNEIKVSLLDSLILLSLKDISTPSNRSLFYKYCFSAVAYYSEFKNSDATFLQLTNSDGLRLIRKDHVADSIAKYAADLKIIYASEGLYAQATAGAINAAQELLDSRLQYDTAYYQNGKFTNKFLPFVTDDPQKFKLAINKIYFERAATQSYIDNLQDLSPFLLNLIQYLQKQYPHD